MKAVKLQYGLRHLLACVCVLALFFWAIKERMLRKESDSQGMWTRIVAEGDWSIAIVPGSAQLRHHDASSSDELTVQVEYRTPEALHAISAQANNIRAHVKLLLFQPGEDKSHSSSSRLLSSHELEPGSHIATLTTTMPCQIGKTLLVYADLSLLWSESDNRKRVKKRESSSGPNDLRMRQPHRAQQPAQSAPLSDQRY